MRLVFSFFAVVVAVACTTPTPVETCVFNSDCTVPLVCRASRCVNECMTDRDCMAGQTCNMGTCEIRGSDVGVDAGDPVADTPSDVGRGDAGCAAETCTVSADAVPPADEDCDGRFDEGCVFEVGTPHAVVAVQTGTGPHYWPRLLDEGRDLCLANGRLVCAHRESPGEPFDRPMEDRALLPGANITAVAFDASGDEVIVEAQSALLIPGLYQVTREGSGWSTPVEVGRGYYHPALSADGLELFAQARPGAGMPTYLVHATRPDRSMPFGAFTDLPLTVPAGTNGESAPFALGDGSLLFSGFRDGEFTNYLAVRPDRGVFEVTATLSGLDPTATHVAYFPATAELFFMSSGPWSTGAATIFRARVCRDGRCPNFAPCTEGAASPDGLHCYAVVPELLSWQQGEDSCGATGRHLASIHSAAENTLVRSLAMGAAGHWIGGRRVAGAAYAWSSGEPVSVVAWALGEPTLPVGTEAFVAISSGTSGWFDEPASTVAIPICESTVWPTW